MREKMEERIIEENVEESKEEAQKTTVSQSNAREKKKRPAWKAVLSWCMTLLAAFVLALVLKNYVIINATVPTGSMENTQSHPELPKVSLSFLL